MFRKAIDVSAVLQLYDTDKHSVSRCFRKVYSPQTAVISRLSRHQSSHAASPKCDSAVFFTLSSFLKQQVTRIQSIPMIQLLFVALMNNELRFCHGITNAISLSRVSLDTIRDSIHLAREINLLHPEERRPILMSKQNSARKHLEVA